MKLINMIKLVRKPSTSTQLKIHVGCELRRPSTYGLHQLFERSAIIESYGEWRIRQSEIEVTSGYVEPTHRVNEAFSEMVSLTDPCINVGC